MDSLYVADMTYTRDPDVTEVHMRFLNDPSHSPGITIHYVIALELIQAIADSGGVDIEILGPRK